MILDKKSEFSFAQSVVGSGTIVSTNVIDTQIPGGDVAVGDAARPKLFARMDSTALAGATSIQVVLQTSSDAAFTAPVVVYSGPVVPVASAVASAVLANTRIPYGCLRYLRVAYVLVGTSTAGTATANIAIDTDKQAAYPSGFTF